METFFLKLPGFSCVTDCSLNMAMRNRFFLDHKTMSNSDNTMFLFLKETKKQELSVLYQQQPPFGVKIS